MRFRVARIDYHGVEVRVAGTGYTGEDGIEIAAPNEVADEMLEHLVERGHHAGRSRGARHLRLEAALPLYGHELSLSSTTLEAKLGWVLGWDKATFRGQTRPSKPSGTRSRSSPHRRHRFEAPAPARRRAGALSRVENVGVLTSGNFSPMLEHGIGLGLFDRPATSDARRRLELRGREVEATIAALPFVRKAK